MSKKNFNWYYKDEYKWNKIDNKKGKRSVYLGDQNNFEKKVVVKLIKIINNNRNNNINNNFLEILKEIYFLACFKTDEYFVDIIDVFLSENGQDVSIVLKDDGVNLLDLIKYSKDDYEEKYPNFTRWILFRVACGLFELHSLNLSYNDIKLSNIIINETGHAKLCDLGSVDKIEKVSNVGTSGYYSPQNLLGKKKTKEDDMWAIGVVFLELLKKKVGLFSYGKNYETNDLNERNKMELIDILKKNYNIMINGRIENNENPINLNKIIDFIKHNDYDAFKVELKDEVLEGINDDNKKIIKQLLEFDPTKRMTIGELINQNIFRHYEYKKQIINYRRDDYDNYLENINNYETFKRYLELIREKLIFLGHNSNEINNK